MARTDRTAPTTWVGIDVRQDTLDACLLPAPGGKHHARSFPNDPAGHAARERPPAWQPPPPDVRELQALSRRRDDPRHLAAREKTRLATPGLTPAARASIRRTVAFLGKEADRLQGRADDLIAASERL